MPRLLPLALLLALSGCSALSPWSETTKLDLTLAGDQRLNPDINGRPSPIVLRLLELRHPAAFENADFFTLYQRPKESLQPDLVTSEELELRPGENRTLKVSLQPGSRYLGVLAAYRDLPESRWRLVIPLQEKQHNRIGLDLDARGIHPRDAVDEKNDKDED